MSLFFWNGFALEPEGGAFVLQDCHCILSKCGCTTWTFCSNGLSKDRPGPDGVRNRFFVTRIRVRAILIVAMIAMFIVNRYDRCGCCGRYVFFTRFRFEALFFVLLFYFFQRQELLMGKITDDGTVFDIVHVAYFMVVPIAFPSCIH